MYSIIDIESNGAGFREESIIEVAIYKFDGHKIVDQFSSIVNPEADITPFVQKLTGITPKMVKTAPKFHELAKRIVEITQGTTLVGHNVEFDYRMLRQSFQRLGYEFDITTLDTIDFAKKIFPKEKSYGLNKITKSLGIPHSDIHRAAGDARATLDLFKMMLNKDYSGNMLQAQKEAKLNNSYQNKIRKIIQDLPSERGIVHFQNKDGEILKTRYFNDLYKNTKKVFNSNNKRWSKIQQETEQVSYELTGNDLLTILIIQTKKLRQKYSLPFGIFYKNDHFMIDEIEKGKKQHPLLRFKSFTQASKALEFIKKEGWTPAEVLEKTDLKHKHILLTFEGRERGEKAFIEIDNGKPTFYGFYELYTQVEDPERRKKLRIPIRTFTTPLRNELKMSLLRNDVSVSPLKN